MFMISLAPLPSVLSLFKHADQNQNVSFPSHRHSQALDHVKTSANSTVSLIVIAVPISPKDHFSIICSLKITNSPTAPITKYLTRAIRATNITECHEILSSRFISNPPLTLSDIIRVIECHYPTLSQRLNKHAPLSLKSSALNLVILGLLIH